MSSERAGQAACVNQILSVLSRLCNQHSDILELLQPQEEEASGERKNDLQAECPTSRKNTKRKSEPRKTKQQLMRIVARHLKAYRTRFPSILLLGLALALGSAVVSSQQDDTSGAQCAVKGLQGTCKCVSFLYSSNVALCQQLQRKSTHYYGRVRTHRDVPGLPFAAGAYVAAIRAPDSLAITRPTLAHARSL